MPLNDQQKDRIVQIINSALSRSTEFNNISADANDLDINADLFHGLLMFQEPDRNPINRIFNSTCINRYGSNDFFYHFKSINSPIRLGRVLDIINNRSIQVSNLLSNEQNDFAEYSELYKRLGLFNKFIPNDYCIQRQNNIYDPAATAPVDDERSNIFIICFSRDYMVQRFWNEYATNHNGICFVFRFYNFVDELRNCFDIRDVAYDDGYRYDFINEINYFLRREFSRLIFLEGVSKFSRFYKRQRYSWEIETRLSFDYNSTYRNFLLNSFPISQDGNRHYITLPFAENTTLQNPFFCFTIQEIICGNNVTDHDYSILASALSNNFPNARITRFNNVLPTIY